MAVAVACALAPASALAMVGPKSDGALSSRLAELAKPAVRSLSPDKQAAALSVAPSGPGSLLRRGNRVLVDVRFDHGAATRLNALRALGARIVASSRRYQTVTVAVAPASLRELAGVAGVETVNEDRAPLVFGSTEPPLANAVGAECEGGSVISEGVEQLHVAEARSQYGVDGSGVTVGILSDSYDTATTEADGSGQIATHAGEDEASGDLPGPASPCSGQTSKVNVLEDLPSSGGYEPADEGRAMAQIVHDVAPQASLAFATAFNGETSFAQNIEKLAKPKGEEGAGAQVIADDVVYFEEPFFQDGPIAAAVNKIAGEGVAYFSAAGNDNLFEGKHEIASWEAPSFRDSGNCPTAVQSLPKFNGTHCMNFNPGAGQKNTEFGITVEPNRTLTVDLQWAESWYGVGTDLDAFLLNTKGEIVAASYENNAGNPEVEEGATQKPVELLQWKNGNKAQEVHLVINRFSGVNPRLKFALLENGRGVSKTEYPESKEGDIVGPTIFGHTGATGAISVAAIPYNTAAQPERYSSRGPVTHYFGPVNGNTEAPRLSSPELIEKPNITATDCGATTFFASFFESEATWRFCGTSAAAPHAAGVAALEINAEPSATLAEIRGAQESTASPIGSFEPEAVGAGLLNADKAVKSLLPPSIVTITNAPSSRTADNTPSFEFKVNPLSPLLCSVDEGPTHSCIDEYTVEIPLPDGQHKFEVEVEGGGDKASFSFAVDTTPPTITIDEPPAITADATPTFAFTASEPAELICAMDKAPGRVCVSPYTAESLPDGTHTFEVTATDQVGNSSTATREVTVDTVAPTVTITSRPPERSADATPTFAFTASEPASFTCSIDGATPQFCTSPYAAPGRLPDGTHTFEVTATDLVGNAGNASASFAIDTRSPQTFFTEHPHRLLRTRHRKARATFRFGSNESEVGFLCKVDRGPLRLCGETLSRRVGAGRHFVVVEARDAVGNIDRTPAVFRFRVKRFG